ncbi:hypothetical protein M2140_001334 [Clostridiales Family XIII bacterium PM5-7]
MEIKNKKGTVAIMIMLFFVTLVGLIFTFIEASKQTAVKGATTALGSLWADSILGEYDLNLQQRYHLFGFYGMPADVVKKVDYFANQSFKTKTYIDYEGTTSSLYHYSLANVDVFREQVIEVGKLVVAERIINREVNVETAHPKGERGVINNEVILNGLPSKGSSSAISISGIVDKLSGFKSIKEGIKTVGNRYLENRYLFSFFRNHLHDRDVGETFFQGEIEYVIGGKHSDDGNISSVKKKIIGLREAVNFAYLLKDPEKSGAALAAAEILTPGPAAVVTHKGVLAAWALAESNNDYKLLINGKRIPLLKTDQSWAIDLESILNDQAGDYIDTGVDQGEDYEDYLNLFINMMDGQVKLLRMMDLIQINMKLLYYEGFSLDTYNGGVRFVMKVNGEEYEMDKSYEKGNLHR